MTNKVVRLNLETKDFQLYSIGNNDAAFSGIAYDGEVFYLSPRRTDAVIVWDGKDKVREIDIDKYYTSRGNFISTSF